MVKIAEIEIRIQETEVSPSTSSGQKDRKQKTVYSISTEAAMSIIQFHAGTE
jgi:hypothetical protein